MRARSLLAIAAFGGLVAVGCGAAESPTAASSAASTSAPTASTTATRLSEPACGDDGACQAGFVLDGAFYAYGCTGLSAEFITSEPLASGDVGDRSISVNEIIGVDPGLMIAVNISANECYRDRDDEGDSGWSAAFADGADTEQLVNTLCEVGEGRTALRGCTGGQADGPKRLPVDTNDDLLVPLDSADYTPWWVGSEVTIPGLPSARLARAYGDGGGSGSLQLEYDSVGFAGFRIHVVSPAAAPIGSLGREVFDSPCAMSEPIEIANGTASLHSRFLPPEAFGPPQIGDGPPAWLSTAAEGCPSGEPNTWMASAVLEGDVRVEVNPPLCYSCFSQPSAETPFAHSPTALKAIIERLVAYPNEPG